MTLTVETGMATALTAVSAGALFVAWPNSEAFNIPCFILGKVYSNSLLRVLNSRNRTEYRRDVTSTPAISIESFSTSLERRSQTQSEEGRDC